MILFDVKCKVVKRISVADSSGNDVEISPGAYHLRGIDHLVRAAAGGSNVTGMDLQIVSESDGEEAQNSGHA